MSLDKGQFSCESDDDSSGSGDNNIVSWGSGKGSMLIHGIWNVGLDIDEKGDAIMPDKLKQMKSKGTESLVVSTKQNETNGRVSKYQRGIDNKEKMKRNGYEAHIDIPKKGHWKQKEQIKNTTSKVTRSVYRERLESSTANGKDTTNTANKDCEFDDSRPNGFGDLIDETDNYNGEDSLFNSTSTDTNMSISGLCRKRNFDDISMEQPPKRRTEEKGEETRSTTFPICIEEAKRIINSGDAVFKPSAKDKMSSS